MGRFFDFLNTPLAVLVVLVVVVGVNAFLYLGQCTPETPATAPAERGGPRTTAVERTERLAGDGEATRPAPTPRAPPLPRAPLLPRRRAGQPRPYLPLFTQPRRETVWKILEGFSTVRVWWQKMSGGDSFVSSRGFSNLHFRAHFDFPVNLPGFFGGSVNGLRPSVVG